MGEKARMRAGNLGKINVVDGARSNTEFSEYAQFCG
jgi:hypothetical protein